MMTASPSLKVVAELRRAPQPWLPGSRPDAARWSWPAPPSRPSASQIAAEIIHHVLDDLRARGAHHRVGHLVDDRVQRVLDDGEGDGIDVRMAASGIVSPSRWRCSPTPSRRARCSRAERRWWCRNSSMMSGAGDGAAARPPRAAASRACRWRGSPRAKETRALAASRPRAPGVDTEACRNRAGCAACRPPTGAGSPAPRGSSSAHSRRSRGRAARRPHACAAASSAGRHRHGELDRLADVAQVGRAAQLRRARRA